MVAAALAWAGDADALATTAASTATRARRWRMPKDVPEQPAGPTFRALSHVECDALLARNHVGRIAFAFRDRIDITPIHYVYEAGWLFGRTSEGAKLATIAHNIWVAFEVDEIRGVFDWASVVVHGTFHRIDLGGSPREQAAGARAIHLLREIVPETFEADDPVEFRTVLFRIAIGEVSGREARPGRSVVENVARQMREKTPDVSERRADRSGW